MIRLCYAHDQLIQSNYDCLALLAFSLKGDNPGR